jgi:Asp-tRNA(Asn)/Glu-tRNA(Gln) amidotransferase A subunit family amidase
MRTQPFLPIILIFAALLSSCKTDKSKATLTLNDVKNTTKTLGLEYSASQMDTLLLDAQQKLKEYKQIRSASVENYTPNPLVFQPIPVGAQINISSQKPQFTQALEAQVPTDEDELAFYTLPELSGLIKNGKISSTALTKLYIKRLKRYADTLQCLITLTEDLAMEQAAKADKELAAGIYRGPLHGIPYGIKDLFAVEGYPTTWGAMPYKDQQINTTATVVKKLEEAGAVLVGKLTLGALAMGDVWYNGVTKNPWDLTQGSSGSSAGSASATSAGLVGFSIGTETWGSIVSPSSRCGVTGLRPTFGRVSRYGAMALSWSMDKVGPICRSARGCAMVFAAIHGKDPLDSSTQAAGFPYIDKQNTDSYKIAYLEELFKEDYREHDNDSITLAMLQQKGYTLTPIKLPADIPIQSLSIILDAEAAAAFAKLTDNDMDTSMVQQHRYAWPAIFRQGRIIPASDYILANQIRSDLQIAMHKLFSKYDVIIAPSFVGDQLLATNLTGQPAVVLPNGFDEKNRPTSITLLGNLFEEHKILHFAGTIQQNTKHHQQHPAFFQK